MSTNILSKYKIKKWSRRGFFGGDDGLVAISWVAWGETSTVMVSSAGAMGSDGLGMSVWGGPSPRCCWIWRRIAVCWSYWARMSLICRNRASCVAFSVLNNSTMARKSKPNTMTKSPDGGGTTSGTWGIAGGSVEVTWGIEDAVGMSGIESVGRSSCCVWSAYAGTRDAGLVGAVSGADSVRFLPASCVHWSRVKCSRQWWRRSRWGSVG